MRVKSFTDIKKLLTLLVLLLISSLGAASTNDSLILVTIYEECSGSSWNLPDSAWMTGIPLHQWKGVTLNSSGRIVELNMSGFGLRGNITWEISDGDDVYYGYLDSLELLDLSNNTNLDYVSYGISSLKKLKHLNLSRCWLTLILEDGHGWEALEHLDLSHNANPADNSFKINIDSLKISRMSKLKYLDLSYNAFDYLPDVFINSQVALEYLNLSHNNLTTTNNTNLGQVTTLKEIDLSFNRLKSLPDFAVLQSGLNNLNLSNNKITSFEMSQTLSQLEKLDLSYNKFVEIPSDIDKLKTLKDLNLSNQRDSIKVTGLNDVTTGLSLPALEKLDLSVNSYSVIPTFVYGLQLLSQFSINDNDISELPSALFTDQLQVLEVGLNNIVDKISDNITNATNLQMLNLSENMIEVLPQSFLGLSNLNELSLQKNPISCNDQTISQEVRAFLNEKSSDWKMTIPEMCDRRYDSLMLVKFYDQCNGKEWSKQDNWKTDAPIDTWFGVGCDENGRVTHLTLRDNNIQGYLPIPLIFENKIKYLDLSGNNIWGVGSDEGDNQAYSERGSWHCNIKKLLLSRNDQIQLRMLLHSTNSDVDSLVLDGCNLNSIPSEIGSAQNLRTLSLKNNRLTTLPSEIGNAQNLITLSLKSNRLTTLPEEIGQLLNLTSIDASDNILESIPKELGNIKPLKTITLENNKLTMIPNELSLIDSLKVLNLNKNEFTLFPKEVAGFKNLNILYLSQNKISYLPPEAVQCPSLTELNISYNLLTALPDYIGDFKTLYILILDGNKLEELNPNLLKLSPITTLSFSQNLNLDLKALPDWMKNMSIGVLGASEVGLERLPTWIDEVVARELWVPDNKISILPAGISNISHLELLGNDIEELPSSFLNNPNTDTLTVAGNKLCDVPVAIQEYLDKYAEADWDTTQRCTDCPKIKDVLSQLQVVEKEKLVLDLNKVVDGKSVYTTSSAKEVLKNEWQVNSLSSFLNLTVDVSKNSVTIIPDDTLSAGSEYLVQFIVTRSDLECEADTVISRVKLVTTPFSVKDVQLVQKSSGLFEGSFKATKTERPLHFVNDMLHMDGFIKINGLDINSAFLPLIYLTDSVSGENEVTYSFSFNSDITAVTKYSFPVALNDWASGRDSITFKLPITDGFIDPLNKEVTVAVDFSAPTTKLRLIKNGMYEQTIGWDAFENEVVTFKRLEIIPLGVNAPPVKTYMLSTSSQTKREVVVDGLQDSRKYEYRLYVEDTMGHEGISSLIAETESDYYSISGTVTGYFHNVTADDISIQISRMTDKLPFDYKGKATIIAVDDTTFSYKMDSLINGEYITTADVKNYYVTKRQIQSEILRADLEHQDFYAQPFPVVDYDGVRITQIPGTGDLSFSVRANKPFEGEYPSAVTLRWFPSAYSETKTLHNAKFELPTFQLSSYSDSIQFWNFVIPRDTIEKRLKDGTLAPSFTKDIRYVNSEIETKISTFPNTVFRNARWAYPTIDVTADEQEGGSVATTNLTHVTIAPQIFTQLKTPFVSTPVSTDSSFSFEIRTKVNSSRIQAFVHLETNDDDGEFVERDRIVNLFPVTPARSVNGHIYTTQKVNWKYAINGLTGKQDIFQYQGLYQKSNPLTGKLNLMGRVGGLAFSADKQRPTSTSTERSYVSYNVQVGAEIDTILSYQVWLHLNMSEHESADLICELRSGSNVYSFSRDGVSSGGWVRLNNGSWGGTKLKTGEYELRIYAPTGSCKIDGYSITTDGGLSLADFEQIYFMRLNPDEEATVTKRVELNNLPVDRGYELSIVLKDRFGNKCDELVESDLYTNDTYYGGGISIGQENETGNLEVTLKTPRLFISDIFQKSSIVKNISLKRFTAFVAGRFYPIFLPDNSIDSEVHTYSFTKKEVGKNGLLAVPVFVHNAHYDSVGITYGIDFEWTDTTRRTTILEYKPNDSMSFAPEGYTLERYTQKVSYKEVLKYLFDIYHPAWEYAKYNKWSEIVSCTLHVYEWIKVDTVQLEFATRPYVVDWPSPNTEFFSSQEYRNPNTPVVEVQETDARNIKLQCNNLNLNSDSTSKQQMAGSLQVTWAPGSLCQDSTVVEIPFGNCFYQDSERNIFYAPSFYSAVESDMGSWVSSGVGTAHQWVDKKGTKGGEFYPNTGYALSNIAQVESSAPYISHRVFIDEEDADTDFSLWVLAGKTLGATSNDVYVEVMQGLSEGRDSHFAGNSGSQMVTINSTDWVYAGSYNVQAGFNTVSLFMAEDGVAIAGVALTKGSIKPTKTANELSSWDSSNKGFDLTIHAKDLASNTNINFKYHAKDRFGNISDTGYITVRTGSLGNKLPTLSITPVGNMGDIFNTGTPEFRVETNGVYDYPLALNVQLQKIEGAVPQDLSGSLVLTGSAEESWTITTKDSVELFTFPEGAITPQDNYTLYAQLSDTTNKQQGDWTKLSFGIQNDSINTVKEVQFADTNYSFLDTLGSNLQIAFFSAVENSDGSIVGKMKVTFDDGITDDILLIENVSLVLASEMQDDVEVYTKILSYDLSNARLAAYSDEMSKKNELELTYGRFRSEVKILDTLAVIDEAQGNIVVAEDGLLEGLIYDDNYAGVRFTGLEQSGNYLPITFNSSGYSTSLLATKDNFYLSNVKTFAEGRDGFSFTSCITIFEKDSVSYNITAARECDGCDDSLSGPFLTYSVIDPKHGGEEFRGYDALEYPMTLSYTDSVQDYTLHWDSLDNGINPIPVSEGKQKEIEYRNWSLVPYSYTFSNSGLTIDSFALNMYQEPILLENDSVPFTIHGFGPLEIKGQDGVHDGNLSIFGDAAVAIPVGGLTLPMDGGYVAYLNGTFQFTAVEGGLDYTLSHVGADGDMTIDLPVYRNNLLSTAGDLSSVFNGSVGEDVVNVTLDELTFDYRRITSLKGDGPITLGIGKVINIIGHVTVDFVSGYFDITIAPTGSEKGVIHIIPNEDSFLTSLLDKGKHNSVEISPTSASLVLHRDVTANKVHETFEKSSLATTYDYSKISFSSLKISDISYNSFLVKALQLSKAVISEQTDQVESVMPQLIPATLLYADLVLQKNGHALGAINTLGDAQLESIAANYGVKEITIPDGYDISLVANQIAAADNSATAEILKKATVLVTLLLKADYADADNYLKNTLKLDTKTLRTSLIVDKSSLKFGPDFSIYSLYGLINLKQLGDIVPPEYADILSVPIDGIEISTIRKRGQKKIMLALLNPQIDMRKLFQSGDDNSKDEKPPVVDLFNLAIDQDLELQALNGKISLGQLQETLRSNVNFLEGISDKVFKLSMNDLFVNFGRKYLDSTTQESADLKLKTSGSVVLGSMFKPIGMNGETILLDQLAASYRVTKENGEYINKNWSLDTLQATAMPYARVIPLFTSAEGGAPVELVSGGKSISVLYQRNDEDGKKNLDLKLQNWTLRFTENFELEALRGLSFHIDKMVYSVPVGTTDTKGKITEFSAKAVYVPPNGELLIEDYGFGGVRMTLAKDTTGDEKTGDLGMYLELAFDKLHVGGKPLDMSCGTSEKSILRVYLDGGFYMKACAKWRENISIVPFGEDFNTNTTKLYIDAASDKEGITLELEIESGKGFSGTLNDVMLRSANGFFDSLDSDLNLDVEIEQVGMAIKKDEKGKRKLEVTKFDAAWKPQHDFLDGCEDFSLSLDLVRLGYTGETAHKGTISSGLNIVEYNYDPYTFFMEGGLTFASKINDECSTAVSPILKYQYQKHANNDPNSPAKSKFDWRIDGVLKCAISGLDFGAKVKIDQGVVGFPMAYVGSKSLNKLLNEGNAKSTITDSLVASLNKKKSAGFDLDVPNDIAGVVIENAYWYKANGWKLNKKEFKAYPTFNHRKPIRIPGIGIGIMGTFDFADIFTKPRGISYEDVSIKLTEKMGGAEVPTGFSVTINGHKPYIHPRWDMPNPITVPIPGIGLTDDIALKGAVMQLGFTEIQNGDEIDRKWYFSGKGSMALTGAIKELAVDVGFEEPNPPINFTGVHHAIVTLKLAKGIKVPLGSTPFFITGFRGGLYDGYAVPLSAQECGFKNMKPGLKMDALMYIEFTRPELVTGDVGFWTHLMALNFGVNGRVTGLKELMDAYVCAALYNGGTAFHANMKLTIGKGLIVQGEFNADAWRDNSGSNLTAEALARIGLKKASLVKRKIIKIPRKTRMWGDFFANFGKFEGGARGATTGIRFFGRSWGLGVIDRRFVKGNMGKYRLKQAPLYNTVNRSFSRSTVNDFDSVGVTDADAPIITFENEDYVLINSGLVGLTGNEVISIAGGVNKNQYDWPAHAFKVAYRENGGYVIDTALINYTSPDEFDSGDVTLEVHEEPYNMKMRMWVNSVGADSVFLCIPALDLAEETSLRSRGVKETKFEYMIMAGLKPAVIDIEADSSGDIITFSGSVSEYTPELKNITIVNEDKDSVTILSQRSDFKLFTSQIAPMTIDTGARENYISNLRPIKLSEFVDYNDTMTRFDQLPGVEYDSTNRVLTITNLRWSKENLGDVGGSYAFAASVDLYDHVIYNEDDSIAISTNSDSVAFFRMLPVNVMHVNSGGVSDDEKKVLTFTLDTPVPDKKVEGLVATGSAATSNWNGESEARELYVNWDLDTKASGYEITWYPKGKRRSIDTVHLLDTIIQFGDSDFDTIYVDTTYIDTQYHVQSQKIGRVDNYTIRIPDVSNWYSAVKTELPKPQIHSHVEYDTVYVTYERPISSALIDTTVAPNGDTTITTPEPIVDSIMKVLSRTVIDSIDKQSHNLALTAEALDTHYYFADEFEIIVTPYTEYMSETTVTYGEGDNQVEVKMPDKEFNVKVELADTVTAKLGVNSGSSRNKLKLNLLDSAGNVLGEDAVIKVDRNGTGSVTLNVNVDNPQLTGVDASNYVGLFTRFAPVDSLTALSLPSVGVQRSYSKLTGSTITSEITFSPIQQDQTCEELFANNCTKVKENEDGTLDTIDCGCDDDDERDAYLDSIALKDRMSPCDYMDSLIQRKTPVGDYDLYVYAVNNGRRANPTGDEEGYSIVDTVTFRVMPPEPVIHGQNKEHYVFERLDTLRVSISSLNKESGSYKVFVGIKDSLNGSFILPLTEFDSESYTIREPEIKDSAEMLYMSDAIWEMPTSKFNPSAANVSGLTDCEVVFQFINNETTSTGEELESTSEIVNFHYITNPKLIECNDTLHYDSDLSKYSMEWFGNYPAEPSIDDSMTVYFSELYEKNPENFHVVLRKFESSSVNDTVPVDTLVINDFELTDYSLRFKPTSGFLDLSHYFELVTSLKQASDIEKCKNHDWGKGDKFKFSSKRSYEIKEVRSGDTVGFKVVPNNGYGGRRSDRIKYYIGNYAVNGGKRYAHYPMPTLVRMTESNMVTVIYSDKNGDNEQTLTAFIRVDEIPRLLYTSGDTVPTAFSALPGDTLLIDYRKDGFSGNFDNAANRAWYHFAGQDKVAGQDLIILGAADTGFVEVGVERILRAKSGNYREYHNVGSRIYQVSINVDSLVASSENIILPHGPVANACGTAAVKNHLLTLEIDTAGLSIPLDSVQFRGADLRPLAGTLLPANKLGAVTLQVAMDTVDGKRVDNRFYLTKGVPNSSSLYKGYSFIASCESGDNLENSLNGDAEPISLLTEPAIVGNGLRLEGGEMPTMTCADLVSYRDQGITFSQWIYLDSLTAGTLVDFHDVMDRADMTLTLSKNGALTFEVNGFKISSPDRTVEPEVWLHIAAATAWTGQADEMKLYVNGYTVAEGAAAKERPYFSDTTKLTLGSGMYGIVDEIRIANRMLTKEALRLETAVLNPDDVFMDGYEGYSECLSINKAERALRKGFKEGIQPYGPSNNLKVTAISDRYMDYAYLERPMSGDSLIALSFDGGAALLLLIPEGETDNIPTGFSTTGERIRLFDDQKQEAVYYTEYSRTHKNSFTVGLEGGVVPAPILLVAPDTATTVDWVAPYWGSIKLHAGDDSEAKPYFDRSYLLGDRADSLQGSVIVAMANSAKGSNSTVEFSVDTFANMHLWVDGGSPVDTMLLYTNGWEPDSATMSLKGYHYTSFYKKRSPGLEILPPLGEISQSTYFAPFITMQKGTAPDDLIDTTIIADGLELDSLYRGVLLYSDTNIICSKVSNDLEGLPFLRTRQADFNVADSLFTIKVKKPTRIYCALDAMQDTLPSFIRKQDSLTGSWRPHYNSEVTNDKHADYRIYSKEFRKGDYRFDGHRYGGTGDNQYNYILIFESLADSIIDDDDDSLDVVHPYWGLHSKTLEVTGIGGERKASSENFIMSDIQIVNGVADSLKSISWKMSATLTPSYVERVDTLKILSPFIDTVLLDSNGQEIDFIDIKDKYTLRDLMPKMINTDAVSVSTMDLSASGSVLLSFKNSGAAPVLDSFRVVLFEDNNGDFRYDPYYDRELQSCMVAPIASGATVLKSFALNDTLSFPEKTLFAFLDAGYHVDELNEQNNVIASSGICDTFEATDFNGSSLSDSLLMKLTGGYTAAITARFLDRNGDSLVTESDEEVLIYVHGHQLYVKSLAGDSLAYGGYIDHTNGNTLRVADVNGDDLPELFCGDLLLSNKLDTLYNGLGIAPAHYDFNGDAVVDTTEIIDGFTVVSDGVDGTLLYVNDMNSWLYPLDSTTVVELASIKQKDRDCYDISVSYPRVEKFATDSLGQDSLNLTVRVANSGSEKIIGRLIAAVSVINSTGSRVIYQEKIAKVNRVDTYSDISFTLVVTDYEKYDYRFEADVRNNWFECNEENNSITKPRGEL